MLLSSERKIQIVEYINRKGTVTIQELANKFSVSEMTIRRDLDDLDKQNIIKRIHGGAMRKEESYFLNKLPFDKRKDQFIEEKQKIGKVAASLVENSDVILFDSGTTCLEVAKNLDNHKNIFAITNSIPISIELSKKNCDVFVTGGFIKEPTQLNLVGNYVNEILEKFSVDKLFLGAMGFHKKRGLVYYNVDETIIRKKMIEIAKEVYIVIDSSKFGRDGLFSIGTLHKVNTIITDYKISEEYVDLCKSKDINIIIAEKDT